MTASDEFVSDPSPMTRHLVDIVTGLNARHEASLQGRSFFAKLKITFQLEKYAKAGFRDYYSFLKAYQPPAFNGDAPGLAAMFREFENFYDKVIVNNLALARVYSATGNLASDLLTMEDQKMFLLKKLAGGEIARSEFLREFGHYALNAFELSARRFDEFSEAELMSVARLAANLKMKPKRPLDDYMAATSTADAAVLIALRELGKYKALLLVAGIRRELLRLAARHNIENIFDLSYADLGRRLPPTSRS